MVGIVIVSHSEKIAQGVKELVTQMGDENQKIIAAGGMEDGRIGTDAMKIKEAIEEANSGDGVVILVDLGSAVLSANMAIEFLEEEVPGKYIIADAPIVEGALSAVIQASCGSDIEEVLQAAQEAAKINKLAN